MTYYYDIWSNIHYGYVGRAVGLSCERLCEAASSAQHVDEQGADETVDTDSIQAGCKLSKQPIEINDLLEIVERNKKTWNSEARRQIWNKAK